MSRLTIIRNISKRNWSTGTSQAHKSSSDSINCDADSNSSEVSLEYSWTLRFVKGPPCRKWVINLLPGYHLGCLSGHRVTTIN